MTPHLSPESDLITPAGRGGSVGRPTDDKQGCEQGFSLIEVVIAMGVLAFAMIAILGLMPAGLKSFRDTMDKNGQALILQYVSGELSRSWSNTSPAPYTTNYYFDDEARPLTSSSDPLCLYRVTAISTNPTAGTFTSANLRSWTVTIVKNGAITNTYPLFQGNSGN